MLRFQHALHWTLWADRPVRVVSLEWLFETDPQPLRPRVTLAGVVACRVDHLSGAAHYYMQEAQASRMVG